MESLRVRILSLLRVGHAERDTLRLSDALSHPFVDKSSWDLVVARREEKPGSGEEVLLIQLLAYTTQFCQAKVNYDSNVSQSLIVHI